MLDEVEPELTLSGTPKPLYLIKVPETNAQPGPVLWPQRRNHVRQTRNTRTPKHPMPSRSKSYETQLVAISNFIISGRGLKSGCDQPDHFDAKQTCRRYHYSQSRGRVIIPAPPIAIPNSDISYGVKPSQSHRAALIQKTAERCNSALYHNGRHPIIILITLSGKR